MQYPKFACERDDIFDCLTDIEYFEGFVKHQYRVSLKDTAAVPKFSSYSCELAYARFTDDIKRMLSAEYDNEGSLDHFKQVSFLVFWLRRFSPISEVSYAIPEQGIIRIKLRSAPTPKRVEHFYLNQNVAFDIGFRMIRYWEARRRDRSNIYGREVSIDDFNMLRDIQRGNYFLKDLAHVLTSKSISPHAICLIYRALFHQLVI